jgi:hypothetical protein
LENRDEISSALDQVHLTPRILQAIEGDVIAGVRGEMNALVESLVSQDFVGEAEVNKRESVRGYIKDPQNAGSRWEKSGKNRLNQFTDRLNRFPLGRSWFTNLLSRRLDRIQNRLSQEKFRLNRFSRNICNDFSDSSDCQRGQSRDDRGTVPKPVEPVSGSVEPVSRAEKQLLNILRRTKVELLWEVKMVFLKGIHDLEKCSRR